MWPFPSSRQPAFDDFGNALEFSPFVGRSSAGALPPGQTLISCSGRVSTSASATVTVPLFTVPNSKTWFETDLNLSTIAAVELDTQIQAGSIPIDREATSSTSPINIVHETQPFAPGGTVVSLLLPQTSGGSVNLDFMVAGYFQSAEGNY